MKPDTTQEFVLNSEHNLHIAAAVHEAFPKAREKIVAGFLEQLDSRLKKN